LTSARIEPAGLADMAGAYRVCLLTGDAGSDATDVCRDPDLLGHVYVGPYLARGLGTQLVVHDDQGVAGYLVSTDDTIAFESWAEAAWWPTLRARYPRRHDGSRDDRLIRLIHEPAPVDPVLAHDYPAHLHVDLLPRTQGRGMGRRLMERLLGELSERGVEGLHFGVDGRNTAALGFYEHLGFERIAERRWGLVMGMRLGEVAEPRPRRRRA
jgi:ribosomal protein S18 acetylase RimI-like enzyme